MHWACVSVQIVRKEVQYLIIEGVTFSITLSSCTMRTLLTVGSCRIYQLTKASESRISEPNPIFTRLRDFAEKRIWLQRRGLVVSLILLSLDFVNSPRRESRCRGVVSLLLTVITPFCVVVPVKRQQPIGVSI